MIACSLAWVVFTPGPPAHADEIKLGGFWIEDVSVNSIEDGYVLYFNRTGSEFSRPIESVQGIRLTAYPLLEQAQDAVISGDDRTAVDLLQQVLVKAQAPWLRHWVGYLMVGAYDRLGMAQDAVSAFLELARDGASQYYLDQPPIDSVASAGSGVKVDLRIRLTDALVENTGRPEAAGIRKLLAALEGQPVDAADGQPSDVATDTAAPTATTQGPSVPGQPTQAQAKLTLAQVLEVGDTVTQMLMYNQYEQALAQVEKILENGGERMPMRLYQRGIAQMGLAESTGDKAQYLAAGVSFMSVVAYYPSSGFAGPSLIEAGTVHDKIGRSDIAKKLYEKAAVILDSDQEPRYADRLEQLMARLDR